MIVGEATLTLAAARRLVFHEVARSAQARNIRLNPHGKLPRVVVQAGDETVGFYDLQAALRHLHAHPDKLVWVWNVDAPAYPQQPLLPGTSALLVLGHPDADWGFPPLASIHTPHQHPGQAGTGAAHPAGEWGDLLQSVQTQTPHRWPVGRIFHDIHPHAQNINVLIRPLRAAIHHAWPDLDQIADVCSVCAHLYGSVRAASFALNTALATAYVHHSAQSAVVTSVADANDRWAVLISPCARETEEEAPVPGPCMSIRHEPTPPWFGR
jgi:hypothetical protein